MPKGNPAGYLPQNQDKPKKKPGEVQREAELEFAKDTGSRREIEKAERALARLRAALAERKKGK